VIDADVRPRLCGCVRHVDAVARTSFAKRPKRSLRFREIFFHSEETSHPARSPSVGAMPGGCGSGTRAAGRGGETHRPTLFSVSVSDFHLTMRNPSARGLTRAENFFHARRVRESSGMWWPLRDAGSPTPAAPKRWPFDCSSETSLHDARILKSPDGAGSYKELAAAPIFVGGGAVPRSLGCGFAALGLAREQVWRLHHCGAGVPAAFPVRAGGTPAPQLARLFLRGPLLPLRLLFRNGFSLTPLQRVGDVRPELLPGLPFGLGQLGQGIRTAYAVEVRISQPVL